MNNPLAEKITRYVAAKRRAALLLLINSALDLKISMPCPDALAASETAAKTRGYILAAHSRLGEILERGGDLDGAAEIKGELARLYKDRCAEPSPLSAEEADELEYYLGVLHESLCFLGILWHFAAPLDDIFGGDIVLKDIYHTSALPASELRLYYENFQPAFQAALESELDGALALEREAAGAIASADTAALDEETRELVNAFEFIVGIYRERIGDLI